MRISDWSSDVCSSDLVFFELAHDVGDRAGLLADRDVDALHARRLLVDDRVDRQRGLAGLTIADDQLALTAADRHHRVDGLVAGLHQLVDRLAGDDRSEEHTSELQSLMRLSYAVFCLKKKNRTNQDTKEH